MPKNGVSGFKFQVSGFRDATTQLSTLHGRQYLEWIQVLDMLLLDTSPCLEAVLSEAMVAWDTVSGP